MLELHKGISLNALEDIKEDREVLLKYKNTWLKDGNEEIHAIFFNDGVKGIERLKSARELADLLIVRCAGDLSNTQIAYYIYEKPIIEYINDFLYKVNMYIKEEILDEKKVLEVATELSFNCNTLEEVKLGLTLLQLFNVDEYIEKIMVLGLYNEYSFYVSRLLVNVKESNKYLFKLCKESNGAAKVQYLSCLEAMDEDVVDWIIAKGLDGEMYSKLLWDLVLMKIDFDEISIKETINKDRFSSLSDIIIKIYLFHGFESIQNFTTVIRNYLSYFNDYADSFDEFIALKLIYKDLIDRRDEGISFSKKSLGKTSFGDLEELYIKAQRAYLKVNWGDELSKAINSDDNNSYLIFQVAIEMDEDLTLDEMEKVLKKDPFEVVWYKYIEVLEDSEYSNLLVKFVEENVDLDKAISGPKNFKESQLTVDDNEEYCLLSVIECMTYDCAKENQDFLVSALSANLIETRMIAIDKLQLIKDDWEEWVINAIDKAINSEINIIIQDREMAMIYEKDEAKVDRFLPTSLYIDPQDDDIFLMNTVIPSKVIKSYYNTDDIFQEGKLVYLEVDDEGDSVLVVSNFGVILGSLPKKDEVIIKNLINGRETLYGRIENASENLDFVYLKIYIKKEPLIVEISNALKDALL